MTVTELLDVLRQLPGEAEVTYEAGCCAVEGVALAVGPDGQAIAVLI